MGTKIQSLIYQKPISQTMISIIPKFEADWCKNEPRTLSVTHVRVLILLPAKGKQKKAVMRMQNRAPVEAMPAKSLHHEKKIPHSGG